MDHKIQVPWTEWTITKMIGRGGFGTVYEIKKDVFGKTEYAALKVMSIPGNAEEIEELYNQGYNEQSISAHYKGHLKDIIREYTIMIDIKGHPNIVYCDDVKYIQHDDGIGWDIFIKMELLKPMNKVASTGYSEEEVIRLGKDLCNALIYCNQQHIIHRDIKPQNIFISKNGSYKLGDFGVAKVTDTTMSGTKTGTYMYMAPEVYRAQKYGARVDIYSLGLVMYWMMNQKCGPFLPPPPQIPTVTEKEQSRNRRMSGEKLPPPEYGSDALKAIVLKACEFDPENRFASAQEMLEALQNMELQRRPQPQPQPQPQPRKKTGNKMLYILLASGAAVAAVVAVVLLLLRMTQPTLQEGETQLPDATNNSVVQHQHIWQEATCTTLRTCTTCGATTGSVSEHKWQEATYDSPETCTVCGATRGSKLQKEAVYLNELSYYDKYGKVYYHDNKHADYANNKDWRDFYTPGHIQQAVKDGYGKTFTYGIHMDGDQLGPYYISYNLNRQYSTFSGWCILPDYKAGTADAKNYGKYFEIYCDGQRVFTSNTMRDGSSSQYFEIDVTGVKVLTIQYATTTGPNDLAVLCDGMLK